PLLQRIQKRIQEDDMDGGSSFVDPNLVPIPAPGAPLGSVTPDGGFASVLPDDDDLPDFVDPDPCKSPEQVKRMPGIVVGRTLAKQLGVDIGDCVQVTSPTAVLTIGAESR